ncbi:conserved protein of unknown function [Georgfuchsia toluolica]|uniref:Gamma-glutamylcyclotransferase n=1 Tax=Georgfuchsia toluolica TaxID=424218 RepID=A0A916J680_9PROT|nr:hypothetical protein [Georgfuchsia toluolica]CAG4884702.1 conserved protein of unknown function [Georgfuchsia toluolica]
MPKKTPCTIPKPPSIAAIRQVVLPEPDHQRQEIAEYVEWQVNKGAETTYKVVHLERLKSEVVFGTEHVVWDVHTDEPGRWWVITGPTNLYSQHEFPSLDYTLSFHVGVTARVAARSAKSAPPSRGDRLRSTWRRWETATDAIDLARESEDFQAVGMRCRETLISLAKSLQKGITVPQGTEPPKAADFVGWSALIAQHFALGSRNEHIRSYIKITAKETWQLVNWLTHTSKAALHEAHLALEATSNLLGMVSLMVMHAEAGSPEACPTCGSYRIVAIYEPDLERDPPYVSLCESCGWNDHDANA